MKRPTPVQLEFDPSLALEHEDKPLRDGLSGAVRTGRNLWIASDEGTSLERLTEVRPGRFAAHVRFPLHDYLSLPGDVDEEVDVEGVGYEDGYLWVVGSHGLKRKKPKKKGDDAEGMERLATVTSDPNRYVLARIPCVPDESAPGADGADGAAVDYVLKREAEVAPGTRRGRGRGTKAAKAAKAAKPVTLVAAQLEGDDEGNALMKAVAKDEHLAPFLAIPGKDNGFDIEGLAVAADRLYVGLRGPVLRGWAMILSIVVEPDADHVHRLRLVEREVGRTGKDKAVERAYAKHFINLGGMGVRELRAVGKDLLILAGPTMALDGTIAVFRWKGGAMADRDCLVPATAVERLFDVPHGTGDDAERDRAEGMTLWPVARGDATPPKKLLVVYDSPRETRKRGEAGVVADLFPIPEAVQRESRRRHPQKKSRRTTSAPVDEDDDLAPGNSLTGRLFSKLGI